MKKIKASSTVFIIAFFVAFLAFSAFAVDGTIIFTQRAKLQSATEAAALAGASAFNSSSNAPTVQLNVVNAAKNTFKLIQVDSLQNLDVTKLSDFNPEVSIAHNEIRITTNYIAQPFFLAFLGVTGIKLEAKACATSEPLYVKANYSTVNWITTAGAYFSDIISKDLNLHDTAILTPLGNFFSASIDNSTGWVMFDALDIDLPSRTPPIPAGTVVPLSLGPGGFITLKMPAPIIDKPGADLYIKEVGDAVEGYFVFAGLDNNPGETTDNSLTTGPYVRADKPGAGITWVNISCSGTPEVKDMNGLIGAYSVSTDGLNLQTKFYGSGYFDLGSSCITGTANDISMAKYIRIVDDNSESAFVKNSVGNVPATNPPTYYKAMLYGEASTDTAGADIDSVSVLNHVRLISPSSYTP